MGPLSLVCNQVSKENHKISIVALVVSTYLSLLALRRAPPLKEQRQQSWRKNQKHTFLHPNPNVYDVCFHVIQARDNAFSCFTGQSYFGSLHLIYISLQQHFQDNTPFPKHMRQAPEEINKMFQQPI